MKKIGKLSQKKTKTDKLANFLISLQTKQSDKKNEWNQTFSSIL